MSENEKPLPRPKDTPFGHKRLFEQDGEENPLLADELAMAASQGKLDEFMQSRMPDNEYAKNLTMMMMGMTGMLPSGDNQTMQGTGKGESLTNSDPTAQPDNTPLGIEPPDDVMNAVQSGDVKGLMGILEREHRKRLPDADKGVSEKNAAAIEQPTIEAEVVERLVKIASDNSLSVDWVVLRALKLYVDEYLKTGRL